MAEEYIRNDLDKIKKSQLLAYIGCSAGPQKKTNIFKWNILLKGPKKSCYEKGLFKLLLEFPDNYPDEPPNIKFLIGHPLNALYTAQLVALNKTDESDVQFLNASPLTSCTLRGIVICLRLVQP